MAAPTSSPTQGIPVNELVKGGEASLAQAGTGANPSSPRLTENSEGPPSRVARLPVELDVAVPVPGFRVRNLIALEKGQVIESQWPHADDLPLAAGNVELAWCEFEVIEARLAVRIARLA